MKHQLLKHAPLYAIGLTILIALTISCSNERKVVDTNEEVSTQDTCANNTSHIYEVYIPANAKDCSQLPLLIIIDPHGNGESAIKRFVPIANKYKCMLVSSKLIKNNYENYLEEITFLIEDANKKYPTNGKIFLTGFSGGARMALSFGQRNIVDGVLACGALATTNQIITIRAPVYALIGMEDFNFIEAAQYFFRPENTPGNLRIELSDATHEWPSGLELSNALAYLFLDGEPGNKNCLDVETISTELTTYKISQINKLKGKNDFLSASLIAKNMTLLHNESSANQFQPVLNSIQYSENLNNELYQLRESIRFELEVRDAYMKAFLNEDLKWWENEIASLNQNISNDKDRFRKLAFKRIKSFLGIMCYTITKKTLQSEDLASAEKLLSIYKLIEPKNPDMFYFYAVYYSEIGKIYEAKSYLQKAINAGFSNQELIGKIGL